MTSQDMRCGETDTWIQQGPGGGGWLRFGKPRCVVSAHTLDEVVPALREVVSRVERDQLWAAGWLSYEAAGAFDTSLQTHSPDALPTLRFTLHGAPERTNLPDAPASSPWGDWQASLKPREYAQAIERIHALIRAGDTYQVNYTYRLRCDDVEDPFARFVALNRAQNAAFGAFIDADRWVVTSASPELFFKLNGTELQSRPMKGTLARNPLPDRDAACAQWLHASAKNRAENVMIVDMLRNDMGKIARTGSVEVPKLLTVERYPTVWQMTSTVTCETDADIVSIFRALFPCASITGAPKHRTMQIIRELELQPRGIYTGAIGYIAPQRRAQFNVAIRTIVMDREKGIAEFGVGGGIVQDSEADGEFKESQIKARVLTHPTEPFALLETIRWTPAEGFFLLARHLDRLTKSGDYFGIPIDREAVLSTLKDTVMGMNSGCMVRLLVNPDGACTVTTRVLPEPTAQPRRLVLAREPVCSDDLFLYHKTTRRGVYERAMESAEGADDVLLVNERGEVTETTIANIMIELNGKRLTPPLESGLLAGTMRSELLAAGEVHEQFLRVADVLEAARIWTLNSVRGVQEARLIPHF